MIHSLFNTLPNDRILDKSEIKAFADDIINLIEKIKTIFGRVKNIVGKGENADYQHFLLFPRCFCKASGSEKSGLCA